MNTRRTATALLVVAVVLAATACASRQPVEPSPRAKAAKALFDEHCKKAGVFIHRTVKDVDGILVMKHRAQMINYGDQYLMDDPYGSDLGGDGYLESFLRGSYLHNTGGQRPRPADWPQRLGYLYVEAVDPSDGRRYRYTGRLEEPWQTSKTFSKGYIRYVMDKVPAPGPAPRYGVTYDDISTREDRDHWIAGSSLRVVDTQTGEVLAERIGYMWDPGQGGNSGGRSAWLHAATYACPSFIKPRNPASPGMAYMQVMYQTLDLVEAALFPTP